MMDTDDSSSPASSTTVPFLVPCFVQPIVFYPLTLFADGRPPAEAEYSLYAWEDSTLADVRPSAARRTTAAVADG